MRKMGVSFWKTVLVLASSLHVSCGDGDFRASTGDEASLSGAVVSRRANTFPRKMKVESKSGKKQGKSQYSKSVSKSGKSDDEAPAKSSSDSHPATSPKSPPQKSYGSKKSKEKSPAMSKKEKGAKSKSKLSKKKSGSKKTSSPTLPPSIHRKCSTFGSARPSHPDLILPLNRSTHTSVTAY